jgi:CRISPR-associated endoribonuclease Cas6
MRLLIKLSSKFTYQYDTEYHYHLQGFIYNLIKDSKYHFLHDKKGYKYFCFSNIFPFSSLIKKNEVKNWIISSPDHEFIDYLDSLLNEIQNKYIRISYMEFEIIGKEKLPFNLNKEQHFSLVTGTPIIIRIPNIKFKQHYIEISKSYKYYYWRKEYPLHLFIFQLENSLIKKYNDFCDYKKIAGKIISESNQFFEKCTFKKQISTRVKINGSRYPIIGTLWEFDFKSYTNQDLIEFAMDAGLGERNSLGFGFMNVSYKSSSIEKQKNT